MLKHDQCQAWEEEVARLKEANKVLREALIYVLGDIEDSIGFYANTEKAILYALVKDDEIRGEKK